MRILVGICAAGSSSRMLGIDKLTAPLKNPADTLLGRAVFAARPFDCCVTLPPMSHPYTAMRRTLIGDAKAIEIQQSHLGLARSVSALAREAAGYDGLVVLLADMPDITSTNVAQVVRVFETFGGTKPVRAISNQGKTGHPVVFPPSLFARLQDLDGDEGGKDLLKHIDVKHVVLESEAATHDIDTPEDLAALRRQE